MKFAAAIVLFLSSSTHASESAHSPIRRRLQATYKPGDFSDGSFIEDTIRKRKVYLSNGLKGKVIAYSNEPLVSDDGTLADKKIDTYHPAADGGACIPKNDGSGGYFYVSNSEQGEYPDNFDPKADRSDYAAQLNGGVFALEFNKDHEFIGYKQVLSLTGGNCAGGATPWGTWISCEERRKWGRCWQVDPFGEIPPEPTDVTGSYAEIDDYGNWEAFAWDGASNPPRGYVTDDDYPRGDGTPAYRGATVRYTPDAKALACLDADTKAGKWCVLNSGTHDYLKLIPATTGASKGTFEWVTELSESNPELYAGAEGVHVQDGVLTFATIVDKEIFRLDLDKMTYHKKKVPFSQEPDNLRILGDTLYLCTDGDEKPNDGIWGYDSQGAFQVFYEENHKYPAGIDFSPDKKRMYVSFWGEATWQFWREDGLAFDDKTAGTKYAVTGGLDYIPSF